MKSFNVEICDVTLRDGEQTPGVSFTFEEKQEIANILDQIGIEVIEAGFPIVSNYEKECVRGIARSGLNAKICCLARARQADIEAAIDSEVDMVSVFIATSDLHIRHKYKKPREEVLLDALEMIDFTRDHGLLVRFAAEDASRTEISFLKEVFKKGAEHGADYLSFADTVGCLTPYEMSEVMHDLVQSIPAPLCAHCHNDLGCATANTICAANAGAFQLHTTVNGIGERAGNAPLEEVLSILNLKCDVTKYDLSLLIKLSKLVEKHSGIPVAKTKPIVGEHAFAHESGIHIAAILEDPRTYEFIPPKLVGGERHFLLGKHTGKHALEYVVNTFGYHLEEDQICWVLDRVKKLGERKCSINDELLRTLIGEAERRY